MEEEKEGKKEEKYFSQFCEDFFSRKVLIEIARLILIDYPF